MSDVYYYKFFIVLFKYRFYRKKLKKYKERLFLKKSRYITNYKKFKNFYFGYKYIFQFKFIFSPLLFFKYFFFGNKFFKFDNKTIIKSLLKFDIKKESGLVYKSNNFFFHFYAIHLFTVLFFSLRILNFSN